MPSKQQEKYQRKLVQLLADMRAVDFKIIYRPDFRTPAESAGHEKELPLFYACGERPGADEQSPVSYYIGINVALVANRLRSVVPHYADEYAQMRSELLVTLGEDVKRSCDRLIEEMNKMPSHLWSEVSDLPFQPGKAV